MFNICLIKYDYRYCTNTINLFDIIDIPINIFLFVSFPFWYICSTSLSSSVFCSSSSSSNDMTTNPIVFPGSYHDLLWSSAVSNP